VWIFQRKTARLPGCLAALLALACGQAGEPQARVRSQVLVSAAASLTAPFGALERAVEDASPPLDVVLNLAGSSALREQILAGAPVDVFASAQLAQMEPVVRAGKIEGAARVFARNRLQIAVPTGNPAGIEALADLARSELWIGLCSEGVPCGSYARQLLDESVISASVDTYEPNVRSLLTKIEAGELDAGIVYATDVLANDGVEGIEIPAAQNVVAEYAIAALREAPNREAARAFVEFVLSDAGQAILARHGFAAP
jgi:molybdate transport system substrate-binding protein